jgi:membrane peptidoglycan carboxypeptidase
VVSADTAASLRKMLRQVVLTGTGKRAQLDGYTSAGKTGTAWKFNPATKRVDPGKYISSFIGFAPADDPQIVIAVVIDEPKSGARDGGGVAAPIFKEAADAILREMNVKPDLQSGADTNVADDIPETPEVPSTGSTDEVLGTAENRSQQPKRPAKAAAPGDVKKPARKGSDNVVGMNHSRVGKYGQWEVWVTKPKT